MKLRVLLFFSFVAISSTIFGQLQWELRGPIKVNASPIPAGSIITVTVDMAEIGSTGGYYDLFCNIIGGGKNLFAVGHLCSIAYPNTFTHTMVFTSNVPVNLPDGNYQIYIIYGQSNCTLCGTEICGGLDAVGDFGEDKNPLDIEINSFACSGWSISPDQANYSHTAGNGSFNVSHTIGTGCVYTVSTGDSWIHPTLGSGNTVNYTVDANQVATSREGYIQVHDDFGHVLTYFTVDQDAYSAGTCLNWSVDPATADFDETGGTGIFKISVLFGDNCSYNVKTTVNWVNGLVNGDPGTVLYNVDNNYDTARTTKILVYDGSNVLQRALTVHQSSGFPVETGVGENAFNNLNIFPNPGNGLYTVTGDMFYTGRLICTVLNSVGQVVYTANVNATRQDFSIDITSQPAGFYYLKLEGATGTTVKKILKGNYANELE